MKFVPNPWTTTLKAVPIPVKWEYCIMWVNKKIQNVPNGSASCTLKVLDTFMQVARRFGIGSRLWPTCGIDSDIVWYLNPVAGCALTFSVLYHLK